MTAQEAAELRARIDRLEADLPAAVERGDDAFHEIAGRILELNTLLEQTTVPVKREDVRAAASAVERWAKQCVPGAGGYLLAVAARLRETLEP